MTKPISLAVYGWSPVIVRGDRGKPQRWLFNDSQVMYQPGFQGGSYMLVHYETLGHIRKISSDTRLKGEVKKVTILSFLQP